MTVVLQVEGLGRNFGGLAALASVDLELRQGEILGLIGPNGAGKTTGFNLISGTLRPSAGRIMLYGQEITGLPPHRIVTRGLTRTFQGTTIYPRATVLENVVRGGLVRHPVRFLSGLFGTAQCREAMAQLQEQALLILEELELGAVRGVEAGNLSYGNQKRLGVAIALASRPDVLLLDEPVAGLNPEESESFGRTIRELRARHDLSILLVEHHMRLVMGLCDRIVVLDHGQKLAEGTPTEIRRNRAVIDAYLGSGDDADH